MTAKGKLRGRNGHGNRAVSMTGTVTILAPSAQPRVFTWQANEAIAGTATHALKLAEQRAKQGVTSITMDHNAAVLSVLSVLAQYAATGLLRATEATERFAAAALAALFFRTYRTEYVITLNEHGQVTRIEEAP